jgi:hypothetical protein
MNNYHKIKQFIPFYGIKFLNYGFGNDISLMMIYHASFSFPLAVSIVKLIQIIFIK